LGYSLIFIVQSVNILFYKLTGRETYTICSTYIDEVVYGWSGVCSIFSFDGKNAYYNKKRYELKSISDDRFYIIIPLSVINMICAWFWISLQTRKTSVLLCIHSFSRLTYIVQGPIYFTRISNELNSSKRYFFVWTQRNQLSIYINIFEVQGVLFNLWLCEMSVISSSGEAPLVGLLLRDCGCYIFLTFTSPNMVLLWQLFYLFCSCI
jgi:hypothetical protein